MGQDVPQPDLILTRTELDGCNEIRLGAGCACYFTSRTPGKESVNEDSLALIGVDSSRGVVALADGFGGQPAGDQASALAARAVASTVREAIKSGAELREAIMDSFERANDAVMALGVGAASTLAVVEIDGERVRAYHAGDSEIITVGQRGKLKQQTVAHSPVGYAYESGVINEAEAMAHDERHLVSNVVGDPEMRIEIGPPLILARRDTLILASDGLTDNLHTGELAELIRKGPLLAAAKNVAAEVKNRMKDPAGDHPSKPDDSTFIIFRRAE